MTGAASVLGLALGASRPPVARARAASGLPLPIPPLIDARREGQAVSLVAQAGRASLIPGTPSRTAGYNGQYLGPTIRVRSGDDVQFTVSNRLAEPTTVHWHGLLAPSSVDGGPHNPISPGETWRPVLPIRQAATTAWYHAHPHPRTGPQVYSGLGGMMIVTDDEEAALGLPSNYGVDDLPLILQDRVFDDAGALIYPQDPLSIMQGVRGDVILVNGAPSPLVRTPASIVRLRLLNAANARIFDLAFEDSRVFHWIGTEGGLLESPVPLTRLELAPGQRAEVLVNFSDARSVSLSTGPDLNLPMGMGGMGMGGMGMGRMGRRRGAGAARSVLRFEPVVTHGMRIGRIPQRLARWTRPDPSRAVRRRRLNLTMGMGMGMMMGRGMGGGTGATHGIDGRSFDMRRIDQRVQLGDVEIWEVSGDMMRHPFHMHGVHFEVLSRDGRAPDLADQGRRDTMLVRDPVELLVQFTQPATEAPFMYHCHVLEHEDHGMMGQYLTD
jgi:FtsP/CotA-like multicopper oxidase with cupredoxin domain